MASIEDLVPENEVWESIKRGNPKLFNQVRIALLLDKARKDVDKLREKISRCTLSDERSLRKEIDNLIEKYGNSLAEPMSNTIPDSCKGAETAKKFLNNEIDKKLHGKDIYKVNHSRDSSLAGQLQ